ncbi:hypothetical protein Gotri_014190, partial [Gossypium trilobum]|nr:hypothetical protein [Gossypium trilobum]
MFAKFIIELDVVAVVSRFHGLPLFSSQFVKWYQELVQRSTHSDMATTMFEIEKFDGETNFNLWQEVLMEKTSSALWKRLETLYATNSLANRLVLKQRLFTFRMNE